MGYDKSEVFDLQAHEAHEQPHPMDEVMDLIKRQMDADRWYAQGLWYAYGRLYCEVAVLTDAEGEADDEATAIGFAFAYQRMMLDFQARRRTTTVRVEAAWANYVTSVGGTVDDA